MMIQLDDRVGGSTDDHMEVSPSSSIDRHGEGRTWMHSFGSQRIRILASASYVHGLYSSVGERWSCKPKVEGSKPSRGNDFFSSLAFFLSQNMICYHHLDACGKLFND